MLKINSTDARQSHVENQAARRLRTIAPEEFARRAERFRSQTYRSDETPNSVPNGWIIVHDENHRRHSFSHRSTFLSYCCIEKDLFDAKVRLRSSFNAAKKSN